MSERELRKGIACHLCLEEALCGLCDKARKALSEPPDVVVLARKLEERVAIFKGNIKAAKTNEDKAYWRGVVDGYDEVKPYLERHVRLTADGWEWVEEGE